jgi:multiple sugar transport system substrate-binding protein
MSRAARRLLVLALAATAMLLAACSSNSSSSTTSAGGSASVGGSASTSAPVTITFLSYTYGQPNPGGEGLSKLLAEFEAANPGIKVNAQSVPVADNLTKLEAESAAGTPPDVTQIGWSKVAQAAATLPFRAFTDVAPAAQWKSTTDGYVPSVISGAAQSSSHSVVALPWLMATPVLFYNASLFKAAGLDPTSPPATVAQVKADALAIKHKTGQAGAYFAVVDPGNSDYLTESVLNSAGGSLVSSASVDSAPMVKAMGAMQDLTTSGAQPAVQFDSAESAFEAGKLGMLVYTAAALPTLDKAVSGKFPLQVGAFPGFDGQSAHPTFSGSGLAIMAKDSAHAAAAWKLVQFLTSDTAYQTIGTQMGYLPLRTADASYSDKRLGPALQQLANLAPYTAFPGSQSNQAVVMLQEKAVAPIVLQGANPASTLHSVSQQIASTLGQ